MSFVVSITSSSVVIVPSAIFPTATAMTYVYKENVFGSIIES